MKRTFQYKLYPNKQQEQKLFAMLEWHRCLYNAALQQRIEAWKRQKKSISYYAQTKGLTELRNEFESIAKLGAHPAQRTLRRLDKAFKAFFRRIKLGQIPGFPRFKSKDRFDSIEYTYGFGAKLNKSNRLAIQNVGHIKVKWQKRPLTGEIKQVVISRKCDNWYASFQVELPNSTPPKHLGERVGIDVGSINLVTLSTGEKVSAPKFLAKSEERLKQDQQQLSTRKRGSSSRKKARKRVAKIHNKIVNQRKDFNHKLSRRLVKEFSLIGLEDLDFSKMSRSHYAKSNLDASWGQLRDFLCYKAGEAGSEVVLVDPKSTTTTCSKCGRSHSVPISQRIFKCPFCGLTIDRDWNAALNIKARAELSSNRKPPVSSVGNPHL